MKCQTYPNVSTFDPKASLKFRDEVLSSVWRTVVYLIILKLDNVCDYSCFLKFNFRFGQISSLQNFYGKILAFNYGVQKGYRKLRTVHEVLTNDLRAHIDALYANDYSIVDACVCTLYSLMGGWSHYSQISQDWSEKTPATLRAFIVYELREFVCASVRYFRIAC
jgi:hypothetical protein